MEDFLLRFAGVFLQVLGVRVALLGLALEVVRTVLEYESKETPRSSTRDDPRQ